MYILKLENVRLN